MANRIQLNLSAATVPTGTKVDLNGLVQLVAQSLSADVEGSFLTGQIGGSAPTQNIGLWVKDGTSLWTWDSGSQSYIQASIPLVRQNLILNVVSDGSEDNVTSFATLQAANDYLLGYQFNPGITVTINVAAGTYTSANPLKLNHPQGNQILVSGVQPTVTRVTGNCDLIAGFYPFNTLKVPVASVLGIAVNDLVVVYGDASVTLDGLWQVTDINGLVLSLQWVSYKAILGFTGSSRLAASGTVTVFPTKFVFTGATGAAFAVGPNGMGQLQNFTILGSGYSGTTGIDVQSPNTVTFLNVGVNGMGIGINADGSGINLNLNALVTCCNHLDSGINVSNNATAVAGGGMMLNGNAKRGLWADANAIVTGDASFTLLACINGGAGLLASDGAAIHIATGQNSQNPVVNSIANASGLNAAADGRILLGGTNTHVISGNTGFDFNVSVGGRIYVAHGLTNAQTFNLANNSQGPFGSVINVAT